MEIRRIRKEEHLKLHDYLNTHWKKNHSLAKSKCLLDYQHLSGDLYTYYAIFDHDEIVGILGYIPTSHFDTRLRDKDAWGAIWKIDDEYNGLGLDLLDELLMNESSHSFGAIGISAIAKKIYKMYGMKSGYMKHYYVANNAMESFSIGRNLQIQPTDSFEADACWNIKIIDDLSPVSLPTPCYFPLKSKEYFINKYAHHPIYKYCFWAICQNEEIISLWAVRRVVVNQSSVLRIVDVLGSLDDIPCVFPQIQQILQEESCEYVDVMNFGISSDIFINMGFTELNIDGNITIVPNYFEPFERCNVKIELAYRADFDYIVFKGDADQDRPNIL